MRNKEDIKSNIEILKTITQTQKELVLANKNFEIAEKELIDYYSYQIKASKAKLDYLIKEVKLKGIELDMVNNLKIGLEEIKAI